MSHSEMRRKDRLAEVEKFAAENEIPVQNAQLLNTALTHTSYANEHKNEVIHDNERLEFLGDAILDLVIGEYLFLRFPTWPEGELTRAKASVVCKPSCAECAAKFHVGEYMRLGTYTWRKYLASPINCTGVPPSARTMVLNQPPNDKAQT